MCDIVKEIGYVKWFNSKSGFGFITVMQSGEHAGSDIFVHHSGLNVSNDQYKYLVQGEYVQLSIEATDDEKHKFKAVGVSGICGGKLMCETRLLYKQTANSSHEQPMLSATKPNRGIKSAGPRGDQKRKTPSSKISENIQFRRSSLEE
uniref:CSD domain-containing protein n=1 Tax=viral metagenome TaxID=1070528 RepID=A0A6C0LME7_9ZZZZ